MQAGQELHDACILLATLGFNLLGDGLRDYFDPTHTR